MKFSAKHSIEPLESRIAPARALIIAGVPNGLPGNDVDYTDTHAPTPGTGVQDPVQAAIDDAFFLDTEAQIALNDTKIAAKVGPGVIGAPDTFYLRMSAGDVLKIYNSQTSTTDPYLSVVKGNIVAFFVDKDFDNEVDEDELTGISMGKNASIILKSGVRGDIVTNLNEFGTANTADDELDMTGLISDTQGIAGIRVEGGRIDGSIIAGGKITNVVAFGTVGSILAGTAANGKMFDFYPSVPGGDGTLNLTLAPGKAGASITNIFVDGLGTPGSVDPLNGVLQAGGGGVGGKGGVVTFVKIAEDADGLTIMGGAGGDSGPGKVNGGAGGAVSRIYIGGFPDPNNSVETVRIEGGAGGDSATGKGGAGGLLKDIFVGYRFEGTKPLPTTDLLMDRVEVVGGAGGSGKVGGAGGSITLADIRVETPEGAGDEISILGGVGGASLIAGGKAGAGGNLLNMFVRNQDLAPVAAYPDTLLRGGDAGVTVPGSVGAAGGNVTNVTLLSWELNVGGGNGSDGKTGGNGGSLTKILVVENDEILTIGARFDAGFGGSGAAGKGGNGGNINGILFTDSDLRDLIINGGTAAANGGLSIGAKGGIGGSVVNVDIRDNNVSNGATFTSLLQPASARTGTGGDGSKGGGAGGTMRLFSIDSTNMNVDLATGAGGNVLGTGAKGKGGAGGSFDTVSVTVRELVDGVPAFANATAGAGGNGAGNAGAGGAGGDFRFATLSASGSSFMRAGQGGDGQVTAGVVRGGASGRGGNIFVSQVTAQDGDGELSAGNAGVNGSKAGVGGSVLGQNAEVRTGLFAHNNVLIQAGHGSHGGAGGSIKYIGYGSGVITLSPTPMGNIVITAGNGSAEGKIAGVGGSIFDVGGSLPSADPTQFGVTFSTTIAAGHGGSSLVKGAAGGSVGEIAILTGGHTGSVLTVQAGDAGDSINAATGAKGGDVKNVTVSSVDLGSIFRSVVAGDGGDAQKKGGAGGNIDGIFVDGIDIGDRRDVPFGLTQMGGIFAGKGGAALTDGLNGKVTNIVAKGIASIVAGRDLIPEAAEFVDKITLSGSNMLLQASNVFTGHGAFRLAYDVTVNATETVAGDVAVQEVQTLDLFALQAAGAQIVYTFGADSTPAQPGDATAADVQAALNALASIKATGPGDTGSVTVADTGDGFTITFDQPGNQTGVVRADATAETAILPNGATNLDVETALDALPTIQYLGANKDGGGVSVSGRNGSFYVTYDESGNVLPLEGIEILAASVTASTEGSITDTVATEQIPGANNLLVTELQSGGGPLPVGEFIAGTTATPETQVFTVDDFFAVPGAQVQFGFSTPFVVDEVTSGDVGVKEVQSISIAAVKADPRATFSLSFNGASTITLPSTATQAQIQAAVNSMTPVAQVGGVSVSLSPANLLTLTFNQNGPRAEFTGFVNSTTALLPAGTSVETDYEAALDQMASIRFLDTTDRVSGDVTVSANGANSYLVLFSEDGDQPLLTLNAFANERQEIESDTLDTDPLADFTLAFSRTYPAVEAVKGSGTAKERQDMVLGPVLGATDTTFTISYNNRTTAVLPGTATDAQIQGAINALGIGNVTVARAAATGTLQITFVANGDNQLLFSAQAVSRTAPLDATATEADVELALEALPTIKGPGAVAETVTVVRQGPGDNDFEVTFDSLGSRDLITAAVVTQEEQHVDVTPILVEPTGSFRLGFGGEYTAELDPTADAATIEAALNGLSTIQAAGGVVVTSTAPSTYDVRFNTPGGQNELDVRFEVDEVQEIDYTVGKPLDLTVVNNVVADEVIMGAAGISEVQVLTLGADVMAAGSPAEFTLTFNGETTTVLRGDASDAEIQAALEQLTSIGVGGATVQSDDSTIQVTFTVQADQPTMTARVTETTTVAETATEADIETALNNLTTVKASGDGATGGSVDVVLGTGSNMTVRFSSGGNQELIVGTQEQPLNVFTVREGGTVVTEVQAFSPQPKGQPLDAAYAIANLIGFYSDHTEIDANVFHYFRGGVRMDSTMDDFRPGDQPIDGILFANKVNQGGLNVVPEAYRIGNVFYDWNNII